MNNNHTKNSIHHPKFGEIKLTLHVVEQLYNRKKLTIENLLPYMDKFVIQNGDKRCPHLRVIDQKIQKWTYPNSDYVYNKYMDLALVVDRITRTAITCLDLNTDYYQPSYR